MRLECEFCGESFAISKKAIRNVIKKADDADCDISTRVVLCPHCERENNIGDGIIAAIVEYSKNKEK